MSSSQPSCLGLRLLGFGDSWGLGLGYHHHQFNTHECSMNNNIRDKTHQMIQTT